MTILFLINEITVPKKFLRAPVEFVFLVCYANDPKCAVFGDLGLFKSFVKERICKVLDNHL